MKFALLLATGLLAGWCPPEVRGQAALLTQARPTEPYRFYAEVKVFADFNFRQPLALSHLRASGTVGGVRYLGPERLFFVNAALTASCLLGRGLGASLIDVNLFPRPQFVATTGLGVQDGPRNRSHEVTQFTPLINSTFRSDYARVLSVATNWVWVDPFLGGSRWQRVGSVFGAWGPVELYYHNDGPFFGGWAGDGKDRYFTGSGYVGLQLPNQASDSRQRPLSFRLGFDRYTSYEKHAYELATALKFDYVPYANNANFYNRGTIRLGVFSENFWGEAVLNDSNTLDFQNLIHLLSGYAYHRTVSKTSFSLRGGARWPTFSDR